MKKICFAIWSLMLLFVSCNHKEFCYHHPHTARLRINVDWSEFSEEQPTGMTVMAFPNAGGKPVTVLSNTIDHVYINLETGIYHTLSFNQSTTEFGAFSFRGMDSWADAEVVNNSVSLRWYTSWSADERVGMEPEWLGVDTEMNGHVTEEMVETTGSHHGKVSMNPPEYVLANHTPRNIIYTMYVKVHIPGGVYNLRSARAAMKGMAESVLLATLRRNNGVMTYLLEEWALTVDKENPVKGTLSTSFRCLGLPTSHQGMATENHFLLSMLLVDGKTQVDVPFEVGHLIEKADDGTLTLYLELTLPEPLPDVQPEGGSNSGFQVTVEDWGEEIEHSIQM